MNNIRAAVLVALAVTGVTCNDLRVGSDHGRIVFNETIQASPAVWRQSQQITVNVTDQEVISSVEVTDQRPDKDGEAKIVDGGEGKQKVTIELKSPTIFRGFDFHVVVYAAQGSVNVQHSLNDAQHPAVITKDFDHNPSATPENKVDDVTPMTPKLTEKPVGNGPNPPALSGDLPRKSRNTVQPDPIVKFVTEKTDNENQQSTTEETLTTEKFAPKVSTDNGLKVNRPVVPVSFAKVDLATEKNNAQANVAFSTFPVKDFDVKILSTTGAPEATTDSGLKVNGPIIPIAPPKIYSTEVDKAQANEQAFSTFPLKDFDVKIPITTGVPDLTTSSTTEKSHEKMVQENFDSISKELGQKIVFGIKKH